MPENTYSVPDVSRFFSLEDFISHPPDHMDWVDGRLIEKTGMTFKHGMAQTKLALALLLDG